MAWRQPAHPSLWEAGARGQRTDTLAGGGDRPMHTTTPLVLVKEALDEGALAGVPARRGLALAIAGRLCALADGGGSTGQASEEPLKDFCGLWGGPLVSPGPWNGDEAQQGLITTLLSRRDRVPAIFLEPKHLLGTSWQTRFSSAADTSLIRRNAFCLVSCPSGHVHQCRRACERPADRVPPCRRPRYTAFAAATFEKSVLGGCKRGQAIGREFESICLLRSLAVLTCAFPISRLRRAPAVLG